MPYNCKHVRGDGEAKTTIVDDIMHFLPLGIHLGGSSLSENSGCIMEWVLDDTTLKIYPTHIFGCSD